MRPITRRGWAVLAVLLVVAACYRHSIDDSFKSNYSDVRIDGGKLIAVATGQPYSGTIVATDQEIGKIGTWLFGGTAMENLAAIDSGGLVLVLPVDNGVPSGRATLHADLRSSKLSAELVSLHGELALSVAKKLSPRVKVAEAVFSNGQLEGKATLWSLASDKSPRVTKLAELSFQRGLPDGVAREYFPGTKQVKRELTFKAGVRSGSQRFFYASGALERDSNFVGGQPHGEMTELYENGATRAKAVYDNGHAVGKEQTWFPTGKLSREVVHAPSGPHVKEWYSNGSLKLSTGPDENVQHPAHGTIVEYFRNGTVRSRAVYEQGVQHGTYSVFYPSKRVREQGGYSAGQRTGQQKKWWKNGRLALDATWSSGALDGPYERWYANGKHWELATYKAGKRTGRYRKWWKNGARAHDYSYNHGKLHGAFLTWYDNGARWAVGIHENGKPVGTMKRWFPDGRLGFIKHHENGRPHGQHKRWYANGTPRLDATYKNGRLEGELRNWLKDGSVYELATYERGAKTRSTLTKKP